MAQKNKSMLSSIKICPKILSPESPNNKIIFFMILEVSKWN